MTPDVQSGHVSAERIVQKSQSRSLCSCFLSKSILSNSLRRKATWEKVFYFLYIRKAWQYVLKQECEIHPTQVSPWRFETVANHTKLCTACTAFLEHNAQSLLSALLIIHRTVVIFAKTRLRSWCPFLMTVLKTETHQCSEVALKWLHTVNSA